MRSILTASNMTMWDIDDLICRPNEWLEDKNERETFKAISERHGIIKRDQFNMGAISQINRGAT